MDKIYGILLLLTIDLFLMMIAQRIYIMVEKV